MSQQDKGKQSKKISKSLKKITKYPKHKEKCLKITKHHIKSIILSHKCIILIITVGWMMVLETLLDV
jgi:hypothetical protein